MKKICFALAVVLCALALFACASGTAVVTGTQRPATNADDVKIYTEVPGGAEVIGIVNAKGEGWTDQDGLNRAVAELKKQAAKIGANGVVINSTGKTTEGGYVTSYGSIIADELQTVSGTAIYVPIE